MRDDITESELDSISNNECLFPSIASDIEFGVTIKSNDFIRYNSAYNVENKLKDKLKTPFIFSNNGSECIIKQIIECLSKECHSWVIPSPTFGLADFYADYYGCIVERPEYNFKNEFYLPLNIYQTKNKALYMVSPHNPTGITLTYEEINSLCHEYRYVIIDEAYIRPDSDILIQRDNLIIVRTFSKMGGITGLRFGYGICFNCTLYNKFLQIRPNYINAITLKYVDYILENFITHKIEQKIQEEIKKLDNLSIIAKAGNFILLEGQKTYNGKPLKHYRIGNKNFYRMTIHETD